MSNIIAAIATPHGEGGISIIRVSGEGSIEALSPYFTGDLSKKKTHTLSYGYFLDQNGEKIDEVLMGLMRGPHSFTGEETVEINCHGGVYVTNKILEILLMDEAIELADPGEFTKRAFLNGKKNLVEAESLMDIIQAGDKQAHQMAMKSLKGETQALIGKLRNDLMDIIAQIEVNIDYPEYEDIEEMTSQLIEPKLASLLSQIDEIIIDSRKGELVKDGINTAIIGAPNVGKSSLLNVLARSDKAIVTDIAGTTRDVIETEINLGHIKLNLIDTAGIRQTDNIVEQIGVEKSKELINSAELVLHLFDASRDLTEEEEEIIESTNGKRLIRIINKIDVSNGKLEERFKDELFISVKEKQGIEDLEQAIIKEFDLASFDVLKSNFVTNTRHIAKLETVSSSLNLAKDNIEMGMPMDMVEIDLKEAMFALGEILGIEVKEDLLNELFSRFCLGK